MISSGKMTLHEMQTIYSLEDVYLTLEVLSIDAYNRKTIAEAEARRKR
jgi:hypothetical protein